ncbi:MAG: GNAT family N-acetyltransferase [Xenococcus sp. (in: cyanobacteria)]
MSSEQTTWKLTITTERLILRPQKPEDYQLWYEGYASRQLDMTGCDREWFIELCHKHQKLALEDRCYIFAIFCQSSERHLGNIDLSTIRREENYWANLGYSIHDPHRRKGYAKEAVKASLMEGFQRLDYHRIEAAINLDNYASIALAKSVGMKQECIRRGFYYKDNQWVDHIIYAAIPPDLGLHEQPPKNFS